VKNFHLIYRNAAQLSEKYSSKAPLFIYDVLLKHPDRYKQPLKILNISLYLLYQLPSTTKECEIDHWWKMNRASIDQELRMPVFALLHVCTLIHIPSLVKVGNFIHITRTKVSDTDFQIFFELLEVCELQMIGDLTPEDNLCIINMAISQCTRQEEKQAYIEICTQAVKKYHERLLQKKQEKKILQADENSEADESSNSNYFFGNNNKVFSLLPEREKDLREAYSALLHIFWETKSFINPQTHKRLTSKEFLAVLGPDWGINKNNFCSAEYHILNAMKRGDADPKDAKLYHFLAGIKTREDEKEAQAEKEETLRLQKQYDSQRADFEEISQTHVWKILQNPFRQVVKRISSLPGILYCLLKNRNVKEAMLAGFMRKSHTTVKKGLSFLHALQIIEHQGTRKEGRYVLSRNKFTRHLCRILSRCFPTLMVDQRAIFRE
jgi:hypothetical protein